MDKDVALVSERSRKIFLSNHILSWNILFIINEQLKNVIFFSSFFFSLFFQYKLKTIDLLQSLIISPINLKLINFIILKNKRHNLFARILNNWIIRYKWFKMEPLCKTKITLFLFWARSMEDIPCSWKPTFICSDQIEITSLPPISFCQIVILLYLFDLFPMDLLF